MDNPPPNYNPNESMLSGGIDVPIMKVMGGGGAMEGGGGAMEGGGGGQQPPDGYNETTSLLSGGINAPIIKVEGGMRSKFRGTPGQVRATEMIEESDELKEQERERRILEIRRQRRRPIINPSQNTLNAVDAADTIQGISERGSDGILYRDQVDNRDELENLIGRKINAYDTGWGPDDQTNATIRGLFEDDNQAKEIQNIRYVTHYDNKDLSLYEEFVRTSSNNLDAAIDKLQKQLDKKELNEKKLHYVEEQYQVGINVISSDIGIYTQIKFIPTNTIEIIVLPPTDTAEAFFNCIFFLVQNKYLTITFEKEFKLKRKIFIVHLNTNLNIPLINYFYLKLKLENENYYLANNPYYIIYPNEIDGKKGLLFLNSQQNLPTTLSANEIEPTNFDKIREYSIKKMAYKTHGGKFYDDAFSVIKGGDTDNNPLDDYNITLNKHIAIIELIDEDIKTIDVDMNGKHYRIRVPHLKDSNDKTFAQWLKGKYKKDEKQLLQDLYVENVPELNTPEKKADILFYLSYFKCFDDVSLLTKNECYVMRNILQQLYKYTVSHGELNID